MLIYNFQLALKSLRERPALTALMVLAIAIGLGLYTTVSTMAHQSGQIPLPHKSERLFLVQMDNRETTAEEVTHQSRMVDTTYRDAIALHKMAIPGVNQTYSWSTWGILSVEDPNITPVKTTAAATTSEFFSMLETPFLYGQGWSATQESNAVIVISKQVNDRLFGGENSVGKTLKLGNHVMTVVGVVNKWNIVRKFYDRSFYSGEPDDFFVPATFAMENELGRDAYFECWSTEAENWRRFRNGATSELYTSECAWVTYWAEVSDGNFEQYQNQVTQYIAQQRELGRFPRGGELFLTNLNDQLNYVNGRNGFINLFSLIAILFFSVCLLNSIGILLAKFMRRSKEVSIRRALGAKKKTIVMQHVFEVVIIGALGGLVGLVVAYYGLQGMLNIRIYASDYTLRVEDVAPMFQLDLTMIGQAFVTGIVCTLIVSIYPIWRLCNVPPASQLKSQ
ncbi:ABC transporter permease [Thalassotalea fusca]